MKVFLTGATGFLGAQIARELGERGHVCLALARNAQGAERLAHIAPKAEICYGDMFAMDSYRPALADFAPEALIHCGWRGVLGAQRNDLAQLDNLAASAALAQAAIAHGARVIIGVGSQAEYGPRSGPFSEDDPATPETLYGVAKLATAGAFMSLGRLHEARAVWGRVFSLYGPGHDGPWLVPSLIRAFASGEALPLTKCEQMWEFTHVRDAARGFVALLETPKASGVFNVASGAPTRLRDAVLMLRDLVAPDVEPQFGAAPYRPDQVMRLEARIERIRAVTDWAPEIGLADGFAETAAAFAQQRKAA
jgi:UDP-glucose 4-epimerase